MKSFIFKLLLSFILIATIKMPLQAQYRNPIIYADVPDMSVCRVGNYYYMISTTMHLMPGAPIMRSTDMKTWQTVSYVFDRINDGNRYDLIDQTVYGQGQWASAIRYHNNKFYVCFTANGAPGRGFVYCADKAEGPWTLIARPPHFHDASLFFDDDNRVYLFHSTGMLTELKSDLSDVKPEGVNMKIFERDADEQGLLEGSFAIKHNGYYYLMMISMDWSIPGRLRREVCYRSEKIMGPYEKKVILEAEFAGYGGVGQGCIVDSPDGKWYALIFQDRGGVGRVPCLMPCNWIDGWPMCGDENGKIPNDLSLDYQDLSGICGSDDFSKSTLSLYWQFNHNPVNSAYSLTDKPGVMRLKTSRVVKNIFLAPNTLTQRIPGPESEACVKIDFKKMKNGDCCGFAAFNGLSGVLSIEKKDNRFYLVMSKQNSVFSKSDRKVIDVEYEEYERIVIKSKPIYLKIAADFTNKADLATFYYSYDNKNYVSIGKPVKMQFDYMRMFMGEKFALFNYATVETGGYVDFDDFDLNISRR